MTEIAVIGEAVADAFLPGDPDAGDALRMEVRPGGGPANTAVALARLGTSAQFLGRLGHGPFGRLLRRHLLASGVELNVVDAPEEATLAVAAIDRSGQAAYEFYARGTGDWQWTRDELLEREPRVGAVHTGSLALVMEPGGPLIEEMLERLRGQTTISIDPNVRPGIVRSEVYRERLARWTRLADIIRLSEDDLAVLAPRAPVAEICDAWHADGVRLVVITRGGDGALASLDGQRVEVPAVAVKAVDTVGAGDAFMAGLLHWLNRQDALGLALTIDDVRTALTFASHIAAETCRVPGADPPWADALSPRALDLLSAGH
ncbi:carbohydrate kinase [Actinomadura barringtoniae]|uniref:Carbohydrate kinase n=1 Tax=Actinomadura barringtoniae TaxID=1427535 RepID=A0A939T7V8_9ACTN|nr:carbohydrate kinase [Actinomadura barringtoniae]MBO2452439.1 carbohydrate kinase [Actinomadura barringtoniae]